MEKKSFLVKVTKIINLHLIEFITLLFKLNQHKNEEERVAMVEVNNVVLNKTIENKAAYRR